jgi:DNA replication protein DnaD
MAKGYIKLHRDIKECWIWKEDEPFTKRDAWIDLLLSANHTDKKILFEGKLKVIHAGQFLTSLVSLSDRWKWDRKKVRKFLDILESDNMIVTDRTAHGTTITLVNWGKYQLEGTTDGTADGQHMGQQRDNSRDTNNNDKECIKNEKNNRYADDDSLNDAIKDFVDHRKKLKKPMTDRAIELLKNKLENLAPADTNKQIQLINTAIEKGWQSVYPEKEKTEQIIQHDDPYANLRELERRYLE